MSDTDTRILQRKKPGKHLTLSASRPQIPGYTIESIVGHGGFATVYLAQQHSLQREVALKVMSPALIGDPDICARFLREARDTASLSDHQHIVTVHDVGQTDAAYYFSMQYLPGLNLKQKIEAAAVTDPWTLIYQLSDALQFIHQRGFIHRDIKPANVLFTESGQAVLSDFGVARLDTHSTQLTQNGAIIGTTRYMSPEQCRGDATIDARSDLYSLGIVLFELLTGHAPFEASDPMALMLKHLNEPAPRLPFKQRKYQTLVDRLLAKSVDQRMGSSAELMQAIKQLPERKILPVNGSEESGSSANILQLESEVGTSTVTTIAVIIFVVLAGLIGFLNTQTRTFLPHHDLRCSSLNKAETQERDALLELATLHVSIGRLTHPPGANAREAYSLALKIDPCNQSIRKAMEQFQPDDTSD